MARYVLAGASGLLGSALRASLRADGHDVVRLVRRAPAGPDERRWDPATSELDPTALAGADAVVCLSGLGVADRRWNAAYKRTWSPAASTALARWPGRWPHGAAPR